MSLKNYTGAGMISIAIILFWSFVMPTYNRISEIDAAVTERQELLNSRTTIIENIYKLDKEYKKRISDIAKLSTIIPPKKSIAEVVSSIESLSGRNGIELFSSSVTSQKTENDKSPYNILNVEMALNGNYLSLVSFLKGLEKNLRIIDLFSIDASKIAREDNSTLLNFAIKGSAYYLK